jgi:Flp pilus assembly protein TadG
VLPLLAMMLFGIAEFSRVLNVQLVINNAARQGARAAATGANVASITQTVRNEAASLTPSDLGIVVTNAQGARGEAVVVALTYPVDLVVDFMGDLFGGSPVLVSAQASMRLE